MRKTCLDMVYELAKADDRIVFIGSDLGAGTLSEMQKKFFMFRERLEPWTLGGQNLTHTTVLEKHIYSILKTNIFCTKV